MLSLEEQKRLLELLKFKSLEEDMHIAEMQSPCRRGPVELGPRPMRTGFQPTGNGISEGSNRPNSASTGATAPWNLGHCWKGTASAENHR